jgi:hypothetical protein
VEKEGENKKEVNDKMEVEIDKDVETGGELKGAHDTDFRSMTKEERSREATRRNIKRRDEETESTKIKKWCCLCVQDKGFEEYDEICASIFKRKSRCKKCIMYGCRRPLRYTHVSCYMTEPIIFMPYSLQEL